MAKNLSVLTTGKKQIGAPTSIKVGTNTTLGGAKKAGKKKVSLRKG